MRTKILPCNCKHDYQDRKYGYRRRAHNRKTDQSTTNWRCTVCGREK